MLQGRVKFYNNAKGYGIICGEDDLDYFVHVSTLGGMSLYEGELVSFEPVQGSRGWQAQSIERHAPPDMVYHIGQIVHVCASRGFGFIRVEGRPFDLFFHITDLNGRSLELGEDIVCLVREDRNGRDRAYSIRSIKE